MQQDDKIKLNELEKDALKEIINISIGQAAQTLEEIIKLYVFMNIPRLEVLGPEELQGFLKAEIPTYKSLHLIEQYFIGKTKGVAYLVLPEKSGNAVLTLLGMDNIDSENCTFDKLEQEALLEIGNIIVGTCVSKISELMGDIVTYLPPRIIEHNENNGYLPSFFLQEDELSYVIIFKTVFHFESKDVEGYLFLINSYESIKWLKKAIDEFISNFA